MGKILRFRRRRRWIKPGAYGASPPGPPFWPDDDRVTLRGVARETVQWLGKLRPFILGAIALMIWPAMDARLAEPPHFASTATETIDQRFTRCGPGRDHGCVVDGDTFRLGDRRIRIIGIDTPEMDARCPEEARLAEQAATQLLAALNAGAFEMRGWAHNSRDRYGRELKALARKMPDGSQRSIAAELREAGVARRYAGGFRGGWC